MFQELQDGWITQAEFDAVQNYVLGYSLGDDGSNANFNPNDYNFDPIGKDVGVLPVGEGLVVGVEGELSDLVVLSDLMLEGVNHAFNGRVPD
jgi:hypothetical protein